MMRCAVAFLFIVWAFGSALAQNSPDSTRVPADTVYVIPAGPVAGSFTGAARLTVLDTVAGWAKIQVEGWVPVRTVLGRMKDSPAASQVEGTGKSAGKAAVSSGQCEALTTKGTRCKRKAVPGSRYCWQHQK